MNTFFKLNTLAIASLIAFSSSSHAQEPAASTPDSRTTIGFGVANGPEYQGAKKDQVRPVLFADYQDKAGFFIGTFRGIGYGTKFDEFNVSAALAYRPGRKDSKDRFFFGSDDLKGMGNIDGSATTQLQASTSIGGKITASVKANLALSHRENGNEYVFGLSAPIYQSKTDQVELGVEATLGDAKFNQTYFGVTAKQNKNSGYKAFQLGQGFNKATLGLTGVHVIDANWSLRNATGIIQTVGDAANSPVTKKKTNQFVMFTANYSF